MTQPLVKNAADESQVKGAEQKMKSARERELADMRFILSTAQGRRVIWRYLEACGVFQISFNHSGAITSFNEGMRNIGLKLLTDINDAAPEAYVTMLKEKETRNV